MSPTSYRTAPPRGRTTSYGFAGGLSIPAQIPKVQLHCHLEGTVSPSLFRRLAQRHGVEIGARARGPLEDTYAFAGFGEFLLLFARVCETLRTPEDFSAVARHYARDAKAQHVRYAELFISPSVWTYFHRELDVRATVEAIRVSLDAEQAAGGPEVALIVDVTRNFGTQRALDTARQAAGMRDLGVIGVGLGGDELRFPARLFSGVYAFARSEGLHRVAHAGEADGAQSVRDAVELLGCERIGHGIRSIEDPSVIALLRERNVTLEVCPTSNRLTGVVPPEARHPLAELHERGVSCAIDADDPALFGTSITQEYDLVERELGAPALIRLARSAIDASFAAENLKVALRAELEEQSGVESAVRERT